MNSKILVRLMKWELEEYMSFPLFEILLVVSIYSILNMPALTIIPDVTYSNLHWGIQEVFFLLIFVVSAIFARSFAGSFVKGEIKLLLSYPIKKWQLFVSKFSILFFIISVVYCAIFSAQIYLLDLNPFEPMIYVSMLGLILQILLFSSIAMSLSLLIKNEIISILAPIFLLYGLESVVGSTSILSYTGRFKILFGHCGLLIHGELPLGIMNAPTIEGVVLSVVVPIVFSAFLVILSLIYFTRVMEID